MKIPCSFICFAMIAQTGAMISVSPCTEMSRPHCTFCKMRKGKHRCQRVIPLQKPWNIILPTLCHPCGFLSQSPQSNSFWITLLQSIANFRKRLIAILKKNAIRCSSKLCFFDLQPFLFCLWNTRNAEQSLIKIRCPANPNPMFSLWHRFSGNSTICFWQAVICLL